MKNSNDETQYRRFTQLLRCGDLKAAEELLPEEDSLDERWQLARMDLLRLADAPTPSKREKGFVGIRPLEVGFAGHWIIIMAGFLPLVVGVLSLEYPPLWMGLLISLLGMASIWFGRKLLEGSEWTLGFLRIHTLIFTAISAFALVSMFISGESFWMQLGSGRGVIVAYGLATFLCAELLILHLQSRPNFRSYFGIPRKKADYVISPEDGLKSLQWVGMAFAVLALGALVNFLNIDQVLKQGPVGDPYALPIILPGSDYLARVWVILYSLVFPVHDLPSLVAAQRIGCIISGILFIAAAWGLWGRKWWSWGLGLAMVVVLSGSLGDIFRLMGNPHADAMLLFAIIGNLAVAYFALWVLLRSGVKLALGADADAELALNLTKKGKKK